MNQETELWVQNISKVYNGASKDQQIVALDNVSFTVQKGEVLGIIGKNGAGKSTLLKILSEITSPTSGKVRYRGRMSSILDIGTGFHPDLSGRENIYLNGALLGYSNVEIAKTYEEILAFSELQEAIEMPVKQYSNGMYLRLAFSIALLFKSDIILLDEVLAVGDAGFRIKCFDAINTLKKEGVTFIMVSHNLRYISNYATRCIWLKKGKVSLIGPPNEIVDQYLSEELGGKQAHERLPIETSDFRLTSFTIETQEPSLDINSAFSIALIIENKTDKSFQFLVSIYTLEGFKILSDSAHFRAFNQGLNRGKYSLKCHIPAGWLSAGNYNIGLQVFEGSQKSVCTMDKLLRFEILSSSNSKFSGLNFPSDTLFPRLDWDVNSMIDE